MHQTTIRFGSDLWEALAVAASAEEVSVAQYVRESAVERLARTGPSEIGEPIASTDRRRDARAPRRAARSLEVAGVGARPGLVPDGPGAAGAARSVPLRPAGTDRSEIVRRSTAGRRGAARNTESSAAVWAQSRLARARARELRAASKALLAARRAARDGVEAPATVAGASALGAADDASHAAT